MCCIAFGMPVMNTANLKKKIGKKHNIFIKIEYNYRYSGLPYFWRDKPGRLLMEKDSSLKTSVLKSLLRISIRILEFRLKIEVFFKKKVFTLGLSRI